MFLVAPGLLQHPEQSGPGQGGRGNQDEAVFFRHDADDNEADVERRVE